MKKLNFKDFKNIFYAWTLVALVIGFSLGFKYYLSFNQPKIDEEAYDQYAINIIYHRDLNNYRVEDRSVSGTRNKIDFYSWGAGLLLVPFHLYSNLLDDVGLDKVSCFWQFNTASTLGSLIFFYIFIYFILELCRKLDLSLSKKDIFIFLLGTSLLWYAIIETNTNQIVFLAFLSFAINLVVDIDYSTLKKSSLKLILLGALFGFSSVIDPVGILYWIGFFIYLFLVFRKQDDVLKILFFYFLGGLAVILIDLFNVQAKFGEILSPFFFIQKDYFGFLTKRFLVISSLLSPQGLFYLSPIYILSFFGCYTYFENGHLMSDKNYRVRALLGVLIIIFVLTAFIKIRYWFPTSILFGRNMLEHQILFILGFAFFIKNKSNFKNFILIAFVAWNNLWLLRYFADKNTFGLFYELPDLNFLLLVWGRLYQAIVFSFKFFPKFMIYFILWSAFIATIYFSFQKVVAKRLFWKSGFFIVLAFFGVTCSNLYFNKLNAKFVVSPSVVESADLFFLPSFLEELKKRKEIALANGKGELAVTLQNKMKETEDLLKLKAPSLLLKPDINDLVCRKDWM